METVARCLSTFLKPISVSQSVIYIYIYLTFVDIQGEWKREKEKAYFGETNKICWRHITEKKKYNHLLVWCLFFSACLTKS
jgi:hypothetical protein